MNVITLEEKYLEIVAVLSDNDGLSRDEIAKKLQVPRSTLFDRLKWLELSEIVDKKVVKRKHGRGRCKVLWYLPT